MSAPIDNGGPAFPIPDYCQRSGMTLRDYFAAKALPVIANGCHEIGKDFLDKKAFGEAARDAYLLADAMLKARSA